MQIKGLKHSCQYVGDKDRIKYQSQKRIIIRLIIIILIISYSCFIYLSISNSNNLIFSQQINDNDLIFNQQINSKLDSKYKINDKQLIQVYHRSLTQVNQQQLYVNNNQKQSDNNQEQVNNNQVQVSNNQEQFNNQKQFKQILKSQEINDIQDDQQNQQTNNKLNIQIIKPIIQQINSNHNFNTNHGNNNNDNNDNNENNRQILIRQKIKGKRNKIIKLQQLQFSIRLIQQLNGNIIYKHKSHSYIQNQNNQKQQQLNSKSESKFQFINPQQLTNEYKQELNKLIIKQKLYYQQKYQLQSLQYQYQQQYHKQLPFCIIIPSYNNINKQLYKKNINSILQQQYHNYHIVYIDDNSSDNTTKQIIKYLSQYQSQKTDIQTILNLIINNQQQGLNIKFNHINWKFIINNQHKYALHNIYHSIHNHCHHNQIAIILDGDDALIGTQTLKLLNQIYSKTQSIFIYSSYTLKKQFQFTQSLNLPQDQGKINQIFKEQNTILKKYINFNHNENQPKIINKVTTYEIGPAGMQIPMNSLRQKTIRQKSYLLASHILTFYVSLFKKIQPYYFTDEQNKFFQYAYDRALTLPLIQMAYKRSYFLKQILYEYRADTGINDSPKNWAQASLKIRLKKPLQYLTDQQMIQMVNNVLNK